jgi:hypothetical protein
MMARQCWEGMDTTRAVCSRFGGRADAAAGLCAHRSSFVGATLGAIAHRCANRLHRHARQFCATVLSTTNSNFVRRQKVPGRSAPPICENAPAVASEQVATGYGILSETSGLGLSRTRLYEPPATARRGKSLPFLAADVLQHRAGVDEIKAGILQRRRPSVRPNKGQAEDALL